MTPTRTPVRSRRLHTHLLDDETCAPPPLSSYGLALLRKERAALLHTPYLEVLATLEVLVPLEDGTERRRRGTRKLMRIGLGKPVRAGSETEALGEWAPAGERVPLAPVPVAANHEEPSRRGLEGARRRRLEETSRRGLEETSRREPRDVPPSRSIFTINNHTYTKLELVGRGGLSKVYKAKNTATNRVYAIKKVGMHQFDESCAQGFRGEIELLLRLKQATDRVVVLSDYLLTNDTLYLVMECGEIDLAHVLHERARFSLDLPFVRYHATEVLRCVAAVHAAGVVHSDLKPANFLFVRGRLKLIDFGISNRVPEHTVNIYRDLQIGTPNYMAPEALVGGGVWKVGRPLDVWLCGCIVYQMVYGRPPYGAYEGVKRIAAIMDERVMVVYPEVGPGGVAVPAQVRRLIAGCLVREPDGRSTAEEVLQLEWLQ